MTRPIFTAESIASVALEELAGILNACYERAVADEAAGMLTARRNAGLDPKLVAMLRFLVR